MRLLFDDRSEDNNCLYGSSIIKEYVFVGLEAILDRWLYSTVLQKEWT